MKRRFLQFSGLMAVVALSLSSYKYGIGGNNGNSNYTGAPGSLGTCGNCHGGSSTTTTATITMKEKVSGQAVTNGKYTPGMAYTVTITGSNSGSLSKYGFQVMPLNAAGSTPGTLTATQASTVVRTMNAGKMLVEQTDMLTGTSATNMASSFDWTAPAAGAGTVTFYGIVNAVNGNNSDNGDKCSPSASAAFTENNPTSVGNLSGNGLDLSLYPNPAQNIVYLRNIHAAGNVQVVNMSGAVVARQEVSGQSAEEMISVSQLPDGLYFVTYTSSGHKVVLPFEKRS